MRRRRHASRCSYLVQVIAEVDPLRWRQGAEVIAGVTGRSISKWSAMSGVTIEASIYPPLISTSIIWHGFSPNDRQFRSDSCSATVGLALLATGPQDDMPLIQTAGLPCDRFNPLARPRPAE